MASCRTKDDDIETLTASDVNLEKLQECWWELFSELLYNLTDSDLTTEECKRKVGVAADLTDAAIEEYEKRWGIRGRHAD